MHALTARVPRISAVGSLRAALLAMMLLLTPTAPATAYGGDTDAVPASIGPDRDVVFISGSATDLTGLCIIIILLLIRPQGLFGREV